MPRFPVLHTVIPCCHGVFPLGCAYFAGSTQEQKLKKEDNINTEHLRWFNIYNERKFPKYFRNDVRNA